MKSVVLAGFDLSVAVARYAPGERMAWHTDERSRISFVVRGSYREESRHRGVVLGPGDVLLKSNRARHKDLFGDEGTVIVSLEFLQDDPFDCLDETFHWRTYGDRFALRHAMAVVEAILTSDVQAARIAATDLLPQPSNTSRRESAPLWLERLKAELEQSGLAAVDVAAHARAAGAHPSHASRLFRRCYGLSITEHAQAQSVRRAFAALACPEIALSEVALSAGFYDQSHMSRVFRRVTGRTPGAHRAMIAAVAC
jgi:AraC-like DNA-binding protein